MTGNLSSNRGLRLRRFGSVMATVVVLTMAFPAMAFAVDGYSTSLDVTVVVRAPEGSITPLAQTDVAEEFWGQTCEVTVFGANQSSVHPNNDFIVESGGTTVVVPDIERDPNGITVGLGPLTLGPTILLSLLMGPDEVFSGGHTLTIECEPIPEPGRIIVVKEVADGSDTTQSFDFTASYDADGFSLADGESNDSGDLDAGTYSVAEVVPDGWSLISAVCDDGSEVDAIDLAAGETVTCTFTNLEDEVLASIVVTVGIACHVDDDELATIAVSTSVAGGATVVVKDSGGATVGTFTENGSVDVSDGASYTWTATPNAGFEFPAGSDTSGTLSAPDCVETLPFTGIETPLLATLAVALIGAGGTLVLRARPTFQ